MGSHSLGRRRATERGNAVSTGAVETGDGVANEEAQGLVGFAPRDLSGEIAPPAGPTTEIQPGVVMQEIAQWLQKLGMSEYVQRFVESWISAAALPPGRRRAGAWRAKPPTDAGSFP